jgi:hypothetical protein
MCECRKEIEAKLLDQFKAQAPEATGHTVSLDGYGWNLNTGGESQATRYEAIAVYPLKKGGAKSKTIRGNMVFNFCPFCGVARKTTKDTHD